MSYWGKIGVHPTPLTSLGELWERTAVGPLPGPVVLIARTVFYLGLLAIALVTFRRYKRVIQDASTRPAQDRLRMLAGAEQY